MLSRIVRTMLSFTAISPIFISLAYVALCDKNWDFVDVFIALFFASISVAFWIIEEAKKRLAGIRFPIKKAKKTDNKIIAFGVFYAFPLMFEDTYHIDFMSLLVASCVLISVLFITGFMPINPVLGLLGYHLYNVNTISNRKYTLITRKHITRLPSVTHAIQIGPYTFLDNDVL